LDAEKQRTVLLCTFFILIYLISKLQNKYWIQI